MWFSSGEKAAGENLLLEKLTCLSIFGLTGRILRRGKNILTF